MVLLSDFHDAPERSSCPEFDKSSLLEKLNIRKNVDTSLVLSLMRRAKWCPEEALR